MELDYLLNWIPVFVLLGIGITGFLFYKKITTKYKIEELREGKKIKKQSETFGGAINEMIDSAPKQLDQINSEIATLKANAVKTGVTPEQLKEMLGRLESEKHMLEYAVKYGHLAKPLGGSIGKLLEKVLGGLG